MDIRPEFVTTAEIDLNLGFLNNRITLDGSFYRAATDLITAATFICFRFSYSSQTLEI
jgi:hypothetical protein